jgi:hypothetical protein
MHGGGGGGQCRRCLARVESGDMEEGGLARVEAVAVAVAVLAMALALAGEPDPLLTVTH